MFERGEYIVYGTSGVCRVENITTMKLDGVSAERLYYELVPVGKAGGRIFTPVDSGKTPMRRIMNREEVARLIAQIPEIQTLWVANEKQREENYKACMRTCDCREWVRIIKTLYQRKQERTAQGKKVTATDERYLRMAKECLYSELEIPLGIPKEELEGYITQQIEREK